MIDHSLCESLPYWEFNSKPFHHAILWDGSVSAGLEILPIDIECFDEFKINHLTLGLRAFANSLPEGMTLQFFVKIESDIEKSLNQHKNLVVSKNIFLKSLDDDRIRTLQDQTLSDNLFRPRLFLFLKTQSAKKPSSFSLKQLQKFSNEFEVNFEDRLQSLGQSLDGIEGSLSSLGFSTFRLSAQEITQVIYNYLNPNRSAIISQPDLAIQKSKIDAVSPRSQLVFGDLVLDKEEFVLDRMRTRVLSLKTLPEFTFAGMMSGFLALPFKYELLFSFTIPNQTTEMRSLEQKRRMAHSLSTSSSNRVSDLESESRLSQTTDLIREIIETGQKVFHAELIIILRETNSAAGVRILNLRTKEVLAKFRTLSGSEGVCESVGSWKIFKSELPLAPLNLVRSKKMKTNNLVDFLPLYGPSVGDENPLCLMKTRFGTLYSFNPYDSKLTNYNMMVTGSSGSGKSFANNFLLLQQIARGTKVFIIDVGGSYKKMTEILGGQYFEINLSKEYAINPFELNDPSKPPSAEKLKALVSIVEQMVVDESEKLSRFERVLLETALTQIFEECSRSQTPRSPLISDLAKHCLASKDESLVKVGKLLFPWTGTSPYGRLLDLPGKISADMPIVAFDLKGLSQYPDLQSVMILILTNFILDQVENDRSTPKRVLLDEAWQLLKSPAASSFMEYAARTFRKTGSGITFVTQGVEEIISNGMGPAILNNTATKLIMLQKGDTQILQNALKLNSQELKLIQSLEQRKGVFSEGFLMEGESRQIIRIQPSPLEYWISTSDSRDNQFLEKLLLHSESLEAAIVEAAKLAPFGVAQLSGVAA